MIHRTGAWHTCAGIVYRHAWHQRDRTPEVSRWIFRTACEKTAAWRAAGLRLGRIGVNLFPSQLANEGFLKDIDDALSDTGLPADVLELEITENVALNFEHATVMQKINEKGVKVAFDQLGTS